MIASCGGKPSASRSHCRDDQAERGVDRTVDGARPEGDDEHDPQHAEDGRVAVDRVDRAVVHRQQAAADAGHAGCQREQHDPQQRRVDPDRRGRGLAPAQRPEVAARRPLAHEDHEQPSHCEHPEHDEEPHAVALREVGSTHADPELAVRDLLAGEDHVLGHEGGRQRGEREVQAAEPRHRPPTGSADEGRQPVDEEHEHRARHGRDDPAEDHPEQHRDAELLGRVGERETPGRGEGRLHQRDLAAETGEDRDREEDDREDERTGEPRHPRRAHEGEHHDDEPDHEDGERDPRELLERRVLVLVCHRRRRRVDTRERVGDLAPLSEPRPEDEQQEQHEERERRAQVGRELARRAEDVGERALTDPDEQAADQGHRDAREPSDRGSSDRGDDEQLCRCSGRA